MVLNVIIFSYHKNINQGTTLDDAPRLAFDRRASLVLLVRTPSLTCWGASLTTLGLGG